MSHNINVLFKKNVDKEKKKRWINSGVRKDKVNG